MSNAGRSSRESRHFGREAAIQLLYQREVGELAGSSVDEAESSYWIERPVAENRKRFAHILLQGTLDTLDRIDPLPGASRKDGGRRGMAEHLRHSPFGLSGSGYGHHGRGTAPSWRDASWSRRDGADRTSDLHR